MKQRILLLLVSTLLSLGLLELILRGLYRPPPYPEGRPPGFFWQQSSELGWTGRPDVEGDYSNGYYRGHVLIDELGNRLSTAGGTFDPGYPTIFFLGDSTTASLEVDGGETVPALLEGELRRRGMGVNVLNFGVRGYGTDQSVRKALLHAERYRPEQIVYMYTDNDVFDNNVIKQPGRPYGKGVYLRRDGVFTAHNYPVPEYERGFYGAVVVDPRGEPVLYTGTAPPAAGGPAPAEAASGPWWMGLSERLEGSLYAYRGILELKRVVWPATRHERELRAWKRRRADPWQVMNDGPAAAADVFYALFHGCVDGGAARLAHPDYYEAQLAHLLGLLWRIPSLRALHLVEFPAEATLDLMSEGRSSTNRKAFESLLRRGLISSYVNLNQVLRDQRLDLRALTCPRDPHFCERGNRWIAEILLAQVSFAVESGATPVNREVTVPAAAAW